MKEQKGAYRDMRKRESQVEAVQNGESAREAEIVAVKDLLYAFKRL